MYASRAAPRPGPMTGALCANPVNSLVGSTDEGTDLGIAECFNVFAQFSLIAPTRVARSFGPLRVGHL
jgi:hypothetical protein